ncbi:MAG: iron ABC transporter permease [Thermodesulfobacteriota bacterium]|nr:iron ABC transporter permease [Thermodesulfobacteriota bacterium]
MHFDDGEVSLAYSSYISGKKVFLTAALFLLVLMLVWGISLGAVSIPFVDVLKTLAGFSVSKQFDIIIWNIRLPQALTALVAGAGLGVAGAVMQSVLRNPLGSPFTLGISHAAAFGAALSVMILGSGVMTSSVSDSVIISNPYVTTFSAFIFAMAAAGIITAVSRIRGASPEVMVLTGVALGSLFTAGTMLLQFFADDIQLAAMVFWTFGDVARANWRELGFVCLVTFGGILFFMANAWNYNGTDAGDETAKGIGIKVETIRLTGMMAASLVTSVIIALVGIIGFVGLVAPHMVRRLIGDDHRFLLPGTMIVGGVLLLASDTVARLMLAPHTLPVSVLTSFIGAPVFIYLIIKGYKR